MRLGLFFMLLIFLHNFIIILQYLPIFQCSYNQSIQLILIDYYTTTDIHLTKTKIVHKYTKQNNYNQKSQPQIIIQEIIYFLILTATYQQHSCSFDITDSLQLKSAMRLLQRQKFVGICVLIIGSILMYGYGLAIGNIIQNDLLNISVEIDGEQMNATIVLDGSWHWIHADKDYQQLCKEGDGWNQNVCSDPISCWMNCAIQGVPSDQWSQVYGISVNKDALQINYVTGNNVGSRMYLADPSGQRYVGINMLARQLSFDADMSQSGCGLNGALYFVEMPLDGGPNLSEGSSASVGLGYCDAQCPVQNYINGKASGVSGYYPTGACCAEFDVWEANSQATQMATHTCKNPGIYECNDDLNCGRNGNRNKGQCDMDGVSVNHYRAGNKTLYGTGSNFAIDTRRPFTVRTQFITDNGLQTGNLVEIRRLYSQDGKTVNGGSITDSNVGEESQTLGLKSMGQSFKRKMVLTFSLWDDSSPAHMLWLDGVYPPGSTQPWAQNGPCPADSGNPDVMRKEVPNSRVIYSKMKVTRLSALETLQEE